MALKSQERSECDQNELKLTEAKYVFNLINALQIKVDRYKSLKKYYIDFFTSGFRVQRPIGILHETGSDLYIY